MIKQYIEHRPTGPVGPTGATGPTGPTGPVYASSSAPFPGIVAPYVGVGTPPSGWVYCDGTAYDGTDPAYAALYGILQSSYNVGGEAANWFRVPNLVNRLPEGRRFNTFTSNTSYTASAAAQLNANLANESGHTHNLPGWNIAANWGNYSWNHNHNSNNVYHEHGGNTDGGGNRNHRNGNGNNTTNGMAAAGSTHNYAVGYNVAPGFNNNVDHGHSFNEGITVRTETSNASGAHGHALPIDASLAGTTQGGDRFGLVQLAFIIKL